MTTTVTRPASSLAVPSTQNTAPVLEFRCLYTYDLRRKAKRWQDGIARFHTFNKRVMVYDETRNFIGDTHWREPEPIQDGDELQLDKGILIQIGEATGQTIQDISGLFEKRKTAPVASDNDFPARARQPPSPAPVPTATRAAQTAPSQLMPRTLNSVLGTPKGHLGRAALPAKSPFELRHAEGVENEAEERAPKRQRVSYPDKRNALSHSASNSKAASKETPSEAEPFHHPIEGSEIDQNREQPAEPKRKSAKKPLNRKSTPQIQKVYDASPEKPRANVTSRERNLGNAMKKASAPNVRSLGRDVNPSEVINVNSSGRSEPREDPTSLGSRLRVATSKPRKKLMYRDLLPLVKQKPDDSPRSAARSVHTKVSRPEPIAPEIDPLSQFHHQEQDRLRARLQKRNHRRSPIQIHDEPEIEENLSFTLSENESVYVSTGMGEKSKTPVDAAVETNDPMSYSPCSSLGETVDNDIISVDESRQPSTSPASKLAKMDAMLLRPTKQTRQENPPPTSITAPNHTAHARPKPPTPLPAIPSAPDPQPPPPLPPPRPTSPKRLQRSLSAVTSSSTTVQQPKRPLRKTVSDTSALFPRTRKGAAGAGLPLPPTNTEAAPDPWSSEAWELFGWRKEDFLGKRGENEPG